MVNSADVIFDHRNEYNRDATGIGIIRQVNAVGVDLLNQLKGKCHQTISEHIILSEEDISSLLYEIAEAPDHAFQILLTPGILALLKQSVNFFI
jgi:hypothetical protein